MSSRGNSLMVTLIALAVLMVLVVGAIRFTGTNREAAVTKLKGDRMAACAETARRTLLAQLRLQGTVAVTDLELDSVNHTAYTRLPDEPAPAKRTVMGPSHYGDDPLTAPRVISVISPKSMGATQTINLSNVLLESSIGGGQYYRVVMKCQEAVGDQRESEVEFVFKYGL